MMMCPSYSAKSCKTSQLLGAKKKEAWVTGQMEMVWLLRGQISFLSQAFKMPPEVQAPFSVSPAACGEGSLFAPLL